MKTRINSIILIIISAVITLIVSLIIARFNNLVLLMCGSLFLFTSAEIVIFYFINKRILYRKQNIFTTLIIIMFCITIITGIVDLIYGSFHLPYYGLIIGIVLLASGNYIMISALSSKPKHVTQEYGEEIDKSENVTLGPYEIIRHPNNLACFIMIFSLPLILGSSLAFIPAGITAILLIVQAVTIDNYRFEEYKWYYDYTLEVPYMMIPVIW